MKRLTPIQAFRKVTMEFLPSIYPWPGVQKSGFPLHLIDGDDATFGLGFPLAGPRFTDLGDGTVLDNVTGRMWIANPGLCDSPIGIGGVGQDLDWDTAIDACMALDYAGYTDWRLPTINELESLFFVMLTGQQIDYNFFTVQNWYYWSSTTYNGLTTAAWLTEYIQGFTIPAQKTSHVLVLPVRGKPCLL